MVGCSDDNPTSPSIDPPENLTAEAVSGSQVDLTWTHNSTETGYRVQRKTATSDNWKKVIELGAGVSSYQDNGVEEGSDYHYRVIALTDESESDPSNVAEVSTPLLAPTGFIVELDPIDRSRVSLEWLDESYKETGYHVHRISSGSDEWTYIAELDSNIQSYIDDDVDEAVVYSYCVNAFNAEYKSATTDSLSAMTPPIAPTDLVAEQDTVSYTTVILGWNDNSSRETGYRVQRRGRGIDDFYPVCGLLPPDTEGYIDENLTPNQWFTYRVCAVCDSVGSKWSKYVNVNTNIRTPAAPTDLNARATSPNSILLRWVDQTGNDGFIIERRLSPEEEWSFLDSLEIPNLMSAFDEGLTDETTYYYRIAAYNSYGNSDYSNEASATTPQDRPARPTNLRMVSATYEAVTLGWDDNSDDELGFKMERRDAGTIIWDDEIELEPDTVTFTDSTVFMNRIYDYRVRSFNDAGDSEWEGVLEVTVPNGPPLPPRITDIEPLSTTSLIIIWRPAAADNHEGFKVERRTGEGEFEDTGGDFERFARSFTDTGLEPETWYFYRVYALNEVGESGYSNVDSAQTQSPIVFKDDFESYNPEEVLNSPPWSTFTQGNSEIFVANTDRHSGFRSVYFQDSTAEDGHFGSLTLETSGLEIGRFTCWLKIAVGGYFGVGGRDPDEQTTFEVQFNADSTILAIHGDIWITLDGCPLDEWFRLDIDFDVQNRSYSIWIDEEIQVENLMLKRSDHRFNSGYRFSTFRDVSLEYGYLDDVEVIDTSGESGAD